MATATDPPKVGSIVEASLTMLGIRLSQAALEADEAVDGLFSLNDMMAEWEVDGINVGYEALDETTDIIHVSAAAIAAIKPNLAIYLAPEYGRIVTNALLRRAKNSKKALRSSIQLRRAQFPDTLPIGSGNEDNNFGADGDSAGSLRSSKFYPSNEEGQCN